MTIKTDGNNCLQLLDRLVLPKNREKSIKKRN